MKGRLSDASDRLFGQPSAVDRCQNHILVVDGFSKTYAMTGWRLGYAIAPETIIYKMRLLLETLCSCVPSFVQYAGIEALTGSQKPIAEMKTIYDRRRKLLVNGLNGIKGIECQNPYGAFYAFPNYRKNRIIR